MIAKFEWQKNIVKLQWIILREKGRKYFNIYWSLYIDNIVELRIELSIFILKSFHQTLIKRIL